MVALDNVKSWVRQNNAPVTAGLIGSLGAAALLGLFVRLPLEAGPNALAQPWTFLTYPWAFSPLGSTMGIVCFLLLLFWLYSVGPSLEREMGSKRFAAFWAIFTIVPGILLWFGFRALGVPGYLAGPILPEAAVTVAWCFRNAYQSVNLYGILPIRAPWIAAITAASLLFSYGAWNPVLGLLAIAPLVVVMLFAQNKLPIAFGEGRYGTGGFGFGGSSARKKEKQHANRAQAQYDEAYYDDVLRRERERDERERLRKLFESSLKDDK